MRDCFWGSAAVKSLPRSPGDDAGNQGGGAVTDCSQLLMGDGGCPLASPCSRVRHLLERYPGS